MADRKISDLTALTTPASGDYLPIVDISEASAANKNKRITIEELLRGAPDGTAGAPGFAFESDPDSGLYSTGANGVALSTGGTGRLFIDASGNVGIGTTSPVRKLSVSNSGAEGIEFGPGLTSNVNYEVHYNRTTAAYISKQTEAAQHIFNSATGEAARIDSSGRLLVGTSSSRTIGSPRTVQIEGTASTYSGLTITHNSANASAPVISLAKTRGSTVGSNTIVQAGDELGYVTFSGADGTDLDQFAAWIRAIVEGTPANNSVASRLEFSTTADGASSPTERMRINSAGNLLVKATSSHTGNSHTFEATSTSSADFGLVVRHPAANGDVRSFAVGCNNYNGDDGFLIIGFRSGGDRLYVKTSGDVQNTNNSYGPISSDQRLKQDITDANSQWDDIKNIRIANFHYKNDPAGPLHLGPIAQELEQVSPGLITRRPASENEIADPSNGLMDGDEVLSFKASILYMKAVKALQEAMERIETLEAKVAALEGA